MKKIFKTVLLICGIFNINFILFAQQEIVTMQRYALVIGNQDYEEYPLKTTIADAELIKTSLEKKGFKVFFYKNLNSQKAQSVFEEYQNFVNKDPKNVSVVFYSGHGYTDGDKNYLVPVNNGDIHDDSMLKEKSISLSVVADGIYSKSQIYIIDGGYDNPYKTVTRGIGISGKLAKVKSQKESSTVYMFSTQPDFSVLEPSGKNSVFALTLANQIDSSNKEIAEMFGDVRNIVASKTNNEQMPYVSATGLNFAFGGEQYKRFQQLQQNSDLDTVKELSAISADSVAAYENSLQNIIDEKARNGQEIRAKLEADIKKQKEEQAAEDRMRLLAELEAAKNRTDAENNEIERQKREFEALAAAQKSTVGKSTSPEEKIQGIEDIKEKIRDIRDDVEEKIRDYNKDINQETYEKVAEVRNKKFDITETDRSGNPTKSALDRREKKCNEIIKAGTDKKIAREKELRASIQKTDTNAMTQLKNMYTSLENTNYVTNSFTDDLVVRIMDFDGTTGTWPLVVTSTLFGYTTLFNYEIPLSYSEVTGKKYIPLEKMNDRQFRKYTETVQLYDSLFRESTDIFYLKLTYKISRWSAASEYRFIPVKCDVVRLDKKSKIIHTEKQTSFEPRQFIIYPQVEIRTPDEIKKDYEKYGNILLKEKAAKENATKQTAVNQKEKVENNNSAGNVIYREEKAYPERTKIERKKEKIEQHGRGAFIVNFETNFAMEECVQNNRPFCDQLGFELDFPIGKFGFWGLNGSYYKPFTKEFETFEAGLDFGLNCRIGKHFRPYIKLTGDLDGTFNAIGKVGGGLDFIFASVLDLTIGYDYCFNYCYGSLFGKESSCPPAANQYQKIYCSLGFAW